MTNVVFLFVYRFVVLRNIQEPVIWAVVSCAIPSAINRQMRAEIVWVTTVKKHINQSGCFKNTPKSQTSRVKKCCPISWICIRAYFAFFLESLNLFSYNLKKKDRHNWIVHICCKSFKKINLKRVLIYICYNSYNFLIGFSKIMLSA